MLPKLRAIAIVVGNAHRKQGDPASPPSVRLAVRNVRLLANGHGMPIVHDDSNSVGSPGEPETLEMQGKHAGTFSAHPPQDTSVPEQRPPSRNGMKPKQLTDQDYWVKNWDAVDHSEESAAVKPRPGAREIFYELLPKRKDWSVVEIGAYPGRKLLELSLSHGYRPTAFDFLPAVKHLPPIFEKYGIHLDAICEDLFQYQVSVRYNVVMSFGFVEHFTNLDDVLGRHWDLVEDGGFLVVEVPSFGPMQMMLRRLILKKEKLNETLRTHNTAVMELKVLREACSRLPQAQIIFARYTNGMRTWFHHSQSYVRKDRAWILWLWKVLGKIPIALGWSTRAFSPNILLVVRRKE